MRSVVCLFTLVAGCLAGAQSIDFTTTAVPLRKALPELSKLAGKRLHASDELIHEPILIRFKGVAVDEALGKIADVMSAEWVTVKDGIELRRTAEIRKRLEEEFVEQRKQALKRKFEDLQAIQAQPALDQAGAAAVAAAYVKIDQDEKSGAGDGRAKQTLANRTAAMRLFAEMVAAIGPDELTRLEPGTYVYTPEPNPAQREVRGISAARLDSFVAEHNLLALEILKRVKPTQEPVFPGDFPGSREIIAGPVRPLLEVETYPYDPVVGLTLQIYDAKGKRVAWISSGAPTEAWANFQTNFGQAMAKARSEQGIPASTELQELASRRRPTQPLKALSPETLKRLTHPEDFDPLSWTFSEGLLGIAEQDHKNLVATQPDDVITRYVVAVQGTSIKPNLLRFMIARSSLLNETEGWITCKPRCPLYTPSQRCNREALGAFERSVADRGYATLEDWAQAALGTPSGPSEGLVTTYFTVLTGQTGLPSPNWNALRLYGSLTEPQAALLSKGGSIDFHTLPSEQKDILTELLYGPSRGDIEPLGKIDSSADSSERYAFRQTLAAEPTESAPNGIPANARLFLENRSQEVFYALEDDQSVGVKRMLPETLEGLASTLAAHESLKGSDLAGWPTILSVKHGGFRSIDIRLQLSNALQLESSLEEEQIPKGDGVEPARLKDALPPDVWNRLSEMVEKYKEQFAKRKIPYTPPVSNPPPR